jgi:hypothetical protein
MDAERLELLLTGSLDDVTVGLMVVRARGGEAIVQIRRQPYSTQCQNLR